jgi:glycosyltransferase involved in cell wall biosynthesis
MSDSRPILLDARSAVPRFPGIGRYVTGLARGLSTVPASRPLVLVHAATPDPRLPLDRLAGIACAALPFDLAQQWQVRRLVRSARAVLYHSPYYLMPFFPGTRAVVTCHDLIPLTVAGLFDPARRAAFRAAHVLAFHAASAIIVPSNATARDVRRWFPRHADKMHVVPEGVEAFDRGEAAPGDLGDLPGGLIESGYVLCVGSNKPHKNLGVLAAAWDRLVSQRAAAAARVRLVMAGPRDPRFPPDATTARLEREGHLVSLGAVSDADLARLYRGARLFVFPSRAEGFGLPVLEAMAHGTPVVVSAIDALVELCAGAAAYAPSGDAGALAAILERLLGNGAERERLRLAGLRRSAGYGWDRTAAATAEVYDLVIGGSS